MATRQQAERALRENAEKLLKHPRVAGVGIGRKESAGVVQTRGWSLRIHVTAKTKRRSKNSVPQFVRIGKGIKVPTDVVEVGPVQLDAPVGSRTKVRVHTMFGTLGALLTAFGDFYVLTAGHVLGHRFLFKLDNPNGILNPRKQLRAFEKSRQIGMGFACSAEDTVDLGLIRLRGIPHRTHPFVNDLRYVNSEPLQATDDLRVLRAAPREILRVGIGSTEDSRMTMSFQYDFPSSAQRTAVTYHGLIAYEQFGTTPTGKKNQRLAKGDSGSAVVDEKGRLIGIHIGSTSSFGYAIPMDKTRSWLNRTECEFSLVGGTGIVSF